MQLVQGSHLCRAASMMSLSNDDAGPAASMWSGRAPAVQPSQPLKAHGSAPISQSLLHILDRVTNQHQGTGSYQASTCTGTGDFAWMQWQCWIKLQGSCVRRHDSLVLKLARACCPRGTTDCPAYTAGGGHDSMVQASAELSAGLAPASTQAGCHPKAAGGSSASR